MTYPFMYYARYLADTNVPNPLEVLANDGFIFLSQKDYESIVAASNKPEITYPLSEAAIKYLLERKVYTLACGDYKQEADQAFRILRNKPWRELMEALLLTRASIPTVVSLFNKTIWTVRGITDDVIYIYRHYFWNVEIMNQDDWYNFLVGCSYPNAKLYWMLVNIPTELGLWLIGYRENAGISRQEALGSLFNLAYAQAVKAAYNDDIQSFHKAVSAAVSIHEACQENAQDVTKVIEELKQIRVIGTPYERPVPLTLLKGDSK